MDKHLKEFKYFLELMASLSQQEDYEEELYQEYFQFAEYAAWEFAVAALEKESTPE